MSVLSRIEARAAALLLSALLLPCCAGVRGDGAASFVPTGPLVFESAYQEYVVRVYRDDEGSFEITRKGWRVYAQVGHKFCVVGSDPGDQTGDSVPIGAAITGDGTPWLAVSEWSGGAHCCFTLHLFQIGERFRHVQSIDLVHSDLAHFENLDADPALEFVTNDWTFAYWHTDFAQSPAPRVVMKYRGDRYRIDVDLMRRPPLAPEEFGRRVRELAALPEWGDEHPPVRLWAEMLDLVYSGNLAQARELIERAWPQGTPGKEQFVADFEGQLRKSPFWADVQALNRLGPS